MKRIKILFVIVTGMLLISGCKKFLDTQPYSTTSTEQFYKTSADAELAITGCYNVLNEQIIQNTNLGSRGGLFFMQLQIMLTGSTDEAVTKFGFSDAANAPWGFASWNASSLYSQQAWFFFYAGIERCNLLLDNIDRITGLADDRKQQIIGEARFLRGFYHMYLGMMWGAVPVRTGADQDVLEPRASLQQVFTQVFDDLNFAYTNLPDRAVTAGRANKWAAAGCLARSYAFLASGKQTAAGTDLNFPLNSFDWVNVADAYGNVKRIADDIIDHSGYILTANYSYLFHETTKSYQEQECLFAVHGSENPTTPNMVNMQNLFIPNGNNATLGGGLGRLVPVGELFAKYHASDPRRINNLTGALTQTKETIDGADYFKPNISITAATIKANATYFGGKFRMIDPANKRIQLNYWSGNFPVLRLAEVYLLRAEAIYFTTGDLVAARADLKTVRARSVAAADLTAVTTAYNRPDFIQELLDERTRELCFEGLRHIDLMRFNRYNTTIAALTTNNSLAFNNQSVATVKTNWAPYRIWFPIPSAETILNSSLVQNPGY